MFNRTSEIWYLYLAGTGIIEVKNDKIRNMLLYLCIG